MMPDPEETSSGGNSDAGEEMSFVERRRRNLEERDKLFKLWKADLAEIEAEARQLQAEEQSATKEVKKKRARSGPSKRTLDIPLKPSRVSLRLQGRKAPNYCEDDVYGSSSKRQKKDYHLRGLRATDLENVSEDLRKEGLNVMELTLVLKGWFARNIRQADLQLQPDVPFSTKKPSALKATVEFVKSVQYHNQLAKTFLQKLSTGAVDPGEMVLKTTTVTPQMLNRVATRVSEKVLDKEHGTTCHQCRQKTLDQKTICRSSTCIGVRGAFCGPCLINRYNVDIKEALQNPVWVCPPCMNACNCSICRRKMHKPATGIMTPMAHQEGFSSVNELLAAREGGVNFREATHKNQEVLTAKLQHETSEMDQDTSDQEKDESMIIGQEKDEAIIIKQENQDTNHQVNTPNEEVDQENAKCSLT